jgi:hypothetical protein
MDELTPQQQADRDIEAAFCRRHHHCTDPLQFILSKDPDEWGELIGEYADEMRLHGYLLENTHYGKLRGGETDGQTDLHR